MSTESFKSLKEFKSYQEQIAHLRDAHSLQISDDAAAQAILETVNYYRLSAYGIGLLDKTTDRYHEGVTIEHLYALYQFDSRLRNILSPVIEYIEIQMRTQIAYLLAMKYGPEGYKDRSNFESWFSKLKKKDMHEVFCEQLDAEINKQKRKPFVRHHLTVYGGHFPIWVAVELLSLGSLSTLYSIMKLDDKKDIAKYFRTNVNYVKSWFAALVELRNICAHYGRIYNMPLDSTPKLPPRYSRFITNRFFTDCLAFRYILNGKSVWNTFVLNLRGAVDECEYLQMDYIGFPDNWETLLR